MNPLNSTIAHYNPYELLKIYSYYRTLLGAILLVMFTGNFVGSLLGSYHPLLFLLSAIAYSLFNIATLGLLGRRLYAPSQRILFAIFGFDIASIVLLMHASGGPVSSIGYLLLIATAASSMMLRGKTATFLASLSTIAVISDSLYISFSGNAQNAPNSLFSAGILGGLIFFTAIIFRYLTKKIMSSNAEAVTQAKHAAQAQNMAQLILERMRTGIVVLDNNNKITMFNNAVAKLLNISYDVQPQLEASPELQEKVTLWQKTQKNPSPILHADSDTNDEVKVSFAQLSPEQTSHTLIFLEDNRAITQQAQQLKLASLGRLTASIAHEIRNPIGAISHASQLLSEYSSLPQGEHRLVEIIHAQTQRVNQIIENVLQLSRRRLSQPETVRLNEWLPKFIADYCIGNKTIEKYGKDAIDCIAPETIYAQFDIGQLQQVLTNLCDNGIRHSKPPRGCARVVLQSGIDTITQQPFIKVIDFGDGITKENLAHLFEPFFTTENTGSGLGLYICKELCEANQALLSYNRTQDGLSCFHIQLAHPNKAL